MANRKPGKNYKKNNYGYITGHDKKHAENAEDTAINSENFQAVTTLQEISRILKPGETLILDIGNNYFNQADVIYDTLVMRGYDVKKYVNNGRNQILVSKKL